MLRQLTLDNGISFYSFHRFSGSLYSCILILFLLLLSLLNANAAGDSIKYSVRIADSFHLKEGSGDSISVPNDELSEGVPVGFDFNFFGNVYDSCYLSSKGFITFSKESGVGWSGEVLPQASQTNNLIAYAWGDLYVNNGIVDYFTEGTAPSRRFVINFNEVPHYGGNDPVTTQVVLYEATGVIEINTTKVNSNYSHTMGIEDSSGTRAYIVGGRNRQTWKAENETVYFIPHISQNDIGISSSLTSTPCLGTQNIQVSLENLGPVSANGVQVNWEFNGVPQTPVLLSEPIPADSAHSQVLVSLGTKIFNPGEEFTVKAWTSFVNGNADPVPFNDSLSVTLVPLMEGDFTIGADGDFTSFKSALSALKSGVCGPVNFKVKSGVYNEHMHLQAVPNVSSVNTVSIQSESGNPEDVTIVHHSSRADSNYVIRLDDADYVALNNLTLKATDSLYSGLVDARGADHLTVTGCRLQGTPPRAQYSQYDYRSLLIVSGSDFSTIRDNVFLNGSSGIKISGTSGSYSRGHLVDNNVLEGQSSIRIYVQYVNGAILTSNLIKPDYSASGGIHVTYGSGVYKIEKNKITVNGGSGIHLSNVRGTAGEEVSIVNNFITNTAEGTYVKGISCSGSAYINLYHNNINLAHPEGAGRVLELSTSSNIEVFNNNLVSHGKGLVFSKAGGSDVKSDFNNCYTKGSDIGRTATNSWSGEQLFQSLIQWTQATGLDSNSISTSPGYASVQDLHVNKVFLDGAGKALPGVSDDIDGEQRQSPPDIGADEFTASGANARLVQLLVPEAPFSPGNHPVYVSISNEGVGELTSLEIHLEVNSAHHTAYSWTGNLSIGEVDTVLLANVDFSDGVTYNLKVFGSAPNASTDSEPGNDTLLVPAVYAALSGTYTIGTDGDFPDFTAAVEALNKGGISGPVTFNVQSGTYEEQVTLEDFPGNSCQTPVIFQSQAADSSAVTLAAKELNGTNYLFRVNGADGITFRNLGFEGSSHTYSRALVLENQSACITVKGCSFQAPHNYSITDSDHALIFASNSSDVKITGNFFDGGGYSIYCTGKSSSEPDSLLEISSNHAFNANQTGIYISYHKAPLVSFNNIDRPGSSGMYLENCSGNLRVERNNIVTFQTGLTIRNCKAESGSEGLVVNNFVSVDTSRAFRGVEIASSTYLKVYHNTIYSISSALYCTYGGNHDIRNNIFFTVGSTYPVYLSNTSNLSLDYNNLYTKGGILVRSGSVEYKTLSDWQTASSFDLHSVSADPMFFSGTDVHVRSAELHNAGIKLPEIEFDIDGEVRDSLPDIGADEFVPVFHDVNLISLIVPQAPFSGEQSLQVVIKNTGAEPLTSFDIYWAVNSEVQELFSWSGTIAPAATDTISFASYFFADKTRHDIVAASVNPNGMSATYTGNDTVHVSKLYAALSGTYTIGGADASFPTIGEALNSLNRGGILEEVTFEIFSGLYEELVYIGDFPGNSCEKPVTFRSWNSDTASVRILWQENFPDNYTVRVNGADGVVFQDLSFEIIETDVYPNTDPAAVKLTKGANCSRFYNCAFYAMKGYKSGRRICFSSLAGASAADNNNDIVLSNCSFTGGTVGVALKGYSTSSSAKHNGIEITGCVFKNQYSNAANLINLNDFHFVKNTVKTFYTNYNFVALNLEYASEGKEISLNTVNTLSGQGLVLTNSSGTSQQKLNVSNNFFSIGGSGDKYGIYGNNSGNINFYYNTVQLYGESSNSASAAVNLKGCTSIGLKNNIFSNTRDGLAFSISRRYDVSDSDYNNFYSSGASLFSSGYNNLTTWRSAYGLDKHSLAVDPKFISDTDLHSRADSLMNAATPLADISLDIDGEPRSTEAPDIGADEMFSSGPDAGIHLVTGPSMPFLHGETEVTALLENHSANTLSSVTINWSVNGVTQAPRTWEGTLAVGERKEVSVGVYNFVHGIPHGLQVWTSFPNGGNDVRQSNDSARVDSLYSGMGGVYTIGGFNPHFDTFSEAVSALKFGGVADSVSFHIRPGYYLEQFIIPEIFGANSSRNITFRAEPGSASEVKLTYEANSDSNYIVQLNGADHIQFHNIVFDAIHGQYSSAIHLKKDADSNVFYGNTFIGAVNYIYGSSPFIYSSQSDNKEEHVDYLRIENNSFKGSGSAIRLFGGGSAVRYKGTGNKILNNEMLDQSSRGIDVSLQDSILISGNTIRYKRNNTEYIGLNAYYLSNALMDRNIIEFDGGRGVILAEPEGTSESPVYFTNNFVFGKGSNHFPGLFIWGGKCVNIYHNTFNLWGPYTGSMVLRCSGDSVKVFNNILAHTGGGLVYNNNGDAFIADYNNLYTTGDFLFPSPSQESSTNLDSWKEYSSQDAHSLSLDPYFYSSTDLHVREARLSGAAKVLPEVKFDIDGEARSATNPDIGADEFLPPVPDDAGIVALNSPAFPFPVGENDLKLSLANYGADTLRNVTVKIAVNNALQTPFSWTGNLAPGKEEVVTIGKAEFLMGVKYQVKAWTEMPNGTSDTLHYNDTLVVENLYVSLNGVYTIGGTDPDFATFSEAVEALKNGGASGPVTFNVRNGVYQEQIDIPHVQGVSAENPVVFQSESGDSTQVMLTYLSSHTSQNYIIRLTGARHYTFRNLSFQKIEGSRYGNIFDLIAGASHIRITGNVLRGTLGGTVNMARLIRVSNSTAAKKIRIDGNLFINGDYGVSYSGPLDSLVLVDHNVFRDQVHAGVQVEGAVRPVITANTISSSRNLNFRGMEFYSCKEGVEISGNRISADKGWSGIIIHRLPSASGANGLISNNFISVGGAGEQTNGIYFHESSDVDLVHNTVNIYSTALEGAAVYISESRNLRMYNNILANQTGNVLESDYSTFVSDYNNFYSLRDTLIQRGLDAFTFEGWVASSRDAHSISADPFFYSESDLHVSQLVLDSAGMVYPGIVTDIDGDARNATHPDIGADEFDRHGSDVGISALISPSTDCQRLPDMQITVEISNFGSEPAGGFDVAYALNDSAVVMENIGDTLIMPGGKLLYTFSPGENFSQIGDYKLRAFSVLSDDERDENDTLEVVVTKMDSLRMDDWKMYPIDNAEDVVGSRNLFSWAPVENVRYYDIYIWRASGNNPIRPATDGDNLTTNHFTNVNWGMFSGETYNWQVVAVGECNTVHSPVQTFTIKHKPDLTVSNVQAPLVEYSGQNLNVSWEVQNIGLGAAEGSWHDYVYIDTKPDFLGTDARKIGSLEKFSFLDPGESYSQAGSFRIPDGLTGEYYVFVSNKGYSIDADLQNNIAVSASPVTIFLTPPADLKVTSLIAPKDVFSSQEVNISWTVTNVGEGIMETDSWYDRVYISESSHFNEGALGYNLGKVQHTGKLAQGESYTVNTTVTIPDGIFGHYYFYVDADYTDFVYEHAMSENNTASDSVNVVLTPPADFVVTNIDIPGNVSAKEKLTIKWTVENQGGSTSDATDWTDKVYYSSYPVYYKDEAILLRTIRQSNVIGPEEHYSAETEITIPDSVTGPFFVHVRTDVNNNIFEYNLEDNNTTTTDTVYFNAPDITVVRATYPEFVASGDTVELSWWVKNAGPGDLIKRNWVDKIYGGYEQQFSQRTVTLIDSLIYGHFIPAGDSIMVELPLIIPDGVSGTYYLHILSDANNHVYEQGREGNNNSPGHSIQVDLTPWADLAASGLVVEDTLKAGTFNSIAFNVSNAGTVVTEVDNWVDRIFISPDSVISGNAISLADIEHHSALKPDSAYHVQNLFNIPVELKGGKYFLHVLSDGDNRIYEHNAEANNLLSKQIYLHPYPPVDLAVTRATVSGQPASGQLVNVAWTVNNIGAERKIPVRWYDGIFLSNDSLWSDDDIYVTNKAFTAKGLNNGEYSDSMPVRLPDGISGPKYLLVVSDYTKMVTDVNPKNNYRAASPADGSGEAIPLDIKLTTPSDLIITSFDAPSVITAGQPFDISWTVMNRGEGVTSERKWVDKIFLSTSNDPNAGGRLVGTFTRTDSLSSGGSYSASLQAVLPVSTSGNYTLVIKTDANDQQYEHGQENNNTSQLPVEAKLPPPSDLIVLNALAPDQARPGEKIDIEWTLKNIGLNPAEGQIKEAVYFSKDTIWDLNDPLAGTFTTSVNIFPGESLRQMQSVELPGMEPGEYHLIVRTDLHNFIYESSDANNKAYSLDKIQLTLRDLPIGIVTEALVENNGQIYFKMDVPANLAGETLIIEVQGDSLHGANEVYVGYNQVPNRIEYDYSHEAGYKRTGNPDLVIPTLQEGTYYIQVFGNTETGASQNLELLPRIINFGIRSIAVNKGGNSGPVTVQLKGAKFNPNLDVRLASETDTVNAAKLYYVNAALAFVTFDLTGTPAGVYDVIALDGIKDTAIVTDGFEVVEGGRSRLLVSLAGPPAVRLKEVATLHIQYANDGLTDIVDPKIIILSVADSPLGLSSGDYTTISELVVPLEETAGPEGILRSGASGSISVYTFGIRYPQFTILVPDHSIEIQ